MPKILVLFAGRPTAMVNAVADGARSIRFSEVEVRRVGALDHAQTGAKPDLHQTLASADEIAPYDAVVVATTEDGVMPPGLEELLTPIAPGSGWQNKVGSAFKAEPGEQQPNVWPTLVTLGKLGMLVVAPSAGSVEAARALGARVAEVVGWVTHARSHHHHAH
jgi:hypothetical protein